MEALLRALMGSLPEPIAPLDTAPIFETALALPSWMAVIVLVLGLGLAGFGSRGMSKRLIMGLAAAVSTFFLVGTFPWLPAAGWVAWAGAVAAGLAGLWSPSLGAGLVGVFVGSWLAGVLWSESPRLAFLRVFMILVCASFLLLLARRLAAIFSAVVGSVMSVIAAIALFPDPLQQTLAAYPAAPLLPMVVIACSGAAFQLARPKERGREGDEEAAPLPADWSPSR